MDLEQQAGDGIRELIGQRFKERKLEHLVQGVLEAQGYHTQPAPVGADGGVDIIAGAGRMGFDLPQQSALTEARRLFFEIRLWDADDLVRALLEHYDRLPTDIRTELPLKQIWIVVPEENEA